MSDAPIVRFVGRVSFVYAGDESFTCSELCSDEKGTVDGTYVGFATEEDVEAWASAGLMESRDEGAPSDMEHAYRTRVTPQLLVNKMMAEMERFPGIYTQTKGWVAKVDIRRNLLEARNKQMKIINDIDALLRGE